MADLGVDHIGSVLVDEQRWKDATVAAAVRTAQKAGARSSLIPLFTCLDTVLKALDFYRPDIVHFCDSLGLPHRIAEACRQAEHWQEQVRGHFPQIGIMRSIPIARPGNSATVPTLELAARLAPLSDFFLTDTWMGDNGDKGAAQQPVAGFVGITGKTCDWDMAARLVQTSGLPVLLAGGIGPDNVGEALARTGPAGIDSCTATNAVDGQGRPVRFAKDPEKVRQIKEEHGLDRRLITASAGGGNVGAPLLKATVRACREALSGENIILKVYTGPYMAREDKEDLRSFENDRIRIREFTPDFVSLLGASDLSLSMAGYNTCMNIVAAGVPALVRPFDQNREQRERAVKLAEFAPITLLEDPDLDPSVLARKMEAALNMQPGPPGQKLDLDGAVNTMTWMRSR